MATTTVYEIVTEKVLNAMASGSVPWRKPWDNSTIRPCNAETGRRYSGGNMFLLSMLPYAVPAFLTMNQIKKAGARIKEGQNKAHFPVFYWNWVEKVDDKGEKTRFPLLRYFLVWNVEQVEGYTLPDHLAKPAAREHTPIEAAERIVTGFADAPEIVITETDRAYYVPALDKVNVPKLSQYAKPESYYSVLFHELAHSTGHASRLNRKEVTDPIAFGSHDYSLEEMVAELTAAFLCAEAGIDNTIENSAAYIAAWHKVLSADPKLFWIAAGRAQKAADYILGRGKDENQDTHND